MDGGVSVTAANVGDGELLSFTWTTVLYNLKHKNIKGLMFGLKAALLITCIMQ